MRIWIFFLNLLFLPFTVGAQVQVVESIVQKGHLQPISVIEWHPSGNYFASGSIDNSIILWDYETGKQIRSFNHHTGKIIDLAFSSDGKYLMSSGSDNLVAIVNCLTGNVIFSHEYQSQYVYPMSICFSPNNDHVFIGDNRDVFTSINIETKELTTTKKGFSARVETMSWSRDQTTYVEIPDYKGFNLIRRTVQDTIFVPFDKPYTHLFSPLSNQIAVASNKLIASIYNSENGELIKTFTASNQCDGCKMKIAYSKDGSLFATFARDEGLKVYKTTNWKQIFESNTVTDASSILFSTDNSIITLTNDDTYTHIHLKTKKSYTTSQTHRDFIKSKLHPTKPIQLVANDVFAIDAINSFTGRKEKAFAGILNSNLQQVKSLNYSSWYNRNIINHLRLKDAVDIDPSGQLMAIGKVDTSVIIREVQTGLFLPKFIHHSSPVFSVHFHPNQPFLITGDAEGYVKIWNIEKRELVASFRPHVRYIFSMAFNASGTELITSSWDGIIKHWTVSKDFTEVSLIDAIDFKNNTGFTVGFSPHDLYLAVGDVDKSFRLFELDTKEEVNKFIGHSKTVSDFRFFQSAGRQLVATVSRDGWLKIWDFNTGTLLRKFSTPRKTPMLSIDYIPSTNHLVLGNADRSIYLYDLNSFKIDFQFKAHLSGVNWVHWNKQSNTLYSRCSDGEIKHWTLLEDSAKLDYTLHVIEQNEWILMSPAGYFDGTAKAMKHINYVQGWKSLEIDLFFNEYYMPKLFEQIIQKDELQDRGLNELMERIPALDVKMNTFQNESISIQEDSIYNHNSSLLTLSIEYSSPSEIESIAVYNNKKRTTTISMDSSPLFRGTQKEKQIEVDLVPGKNELRLELITHDGLRSASKHLRVVYDTLLGRRELYIVSLGINNYLNNSYNLNYAKSDAQSFSKQLGNGAKELFEEVHMITLYNNDVNRKNVMNEINSIIEKIGPEDVFVFYYAGHGVMIPNPKSNESSFFLVMSDITNMYGNYLDIVESGISGEDLFQLAKRIPAQKQLFVIDACQSGGALHAGNVRGVAREKAIAKLARSSGTFFITASQEMEYANESTDLKHGLFTYAILELLDGENETANKFSLDQIISANELKSYVESRVPELSEKYKGSPQYPTGYSFGNDFPIIERK